jgi:hypothetical protein
MRGDFYIQRTIDGLQIKNPNKNIGYICCNDKKLYCFTGDSLTLEMDILDIIISADGILFKGIEKLQDGQRMIYNEVWFLPRGY